MLQRRQNDRPKTISNDNIDLPAFTPIGFSPKATLPPFFNFLLSRTYDQQRGPWPEDRPLPLPVWSDTPRPSYQFVNVLEFEALALVVENKVQHLLVEHNYNSVTNFLKLYLDFKRSSELDVSAFFQKRTPEITDEHLTCVGLALELRKRISGLENKYSGLTQCMYLVSCEEHVDNLNEYVNTDIDLWEYTVEKEHVMLALKVDIGGRKGIILCDPGYHVARVVIVMEDECYPHTGKFRQSEETDEVVKEYEYKFNKTNPEFINWFDTETRNGVSKANVSPIYINRPYLTAVDLTERRNFVYDFRSLLARNMKGHLIAGIYFPIKKGRKDFTIFYQGVQGRKEKKKMNFDDFLNPEKLDENTLEIVETCNMQLNLSTSMNLLQHLVTLAYLMNDEEYIESLLTINEEILQMT